VQLPIITRQQQFCSRGLAAALDFRDVRGAGHPGLVEQHQITWLQRRPVIQEIVGVQREDPVPAQQHGRSLRRGGAKHPPTRCRPRFLQRPQYVGLSGARRRAQHLHLRPRREDAGDDRGLLGG
jgi:hypothetical protein